MSIGQPLPRPDGPAKVTGRARYAADHGAQGLLHAVLVIATIPAGRLTAIDAEGALAERGVVRVLTHEDMPAFGALGGPPSAQSFMPMQGDEIRHEGQPLAIVLGATLEAAEAAAPGGGALRARRGTASGGVGVGGARRGRRGTTKE